MRQQDQSTRMFPMIGVMLVVIAVSPPIVGPLLSQTVQPAPGPDAELQDPRSDSSADTLAASSPASSGSTETREPTSRVPGLLSLRGKVTTVEAGTVPNAEVWIARVDEPDRRIAETRSDARGEFSLELPAPQPAAGLVLRTRHPGGRQSCELLDYVLVPDELPVTMVSKDPGDGYDEPNLDVVDAWLKQRILRRQHVGQDSRGAKKGRVSPQGDSRKPTTEEARLKEIWVALRDADSADARLLASVGLMRVGAWATAEKILASLNNPQVQREKVVLEGVRWNLLRRPDEATRVLERTLLAQMEDALPNLELGRAAVLSEDWPSALQRLDPVLRDKALAPFAHYLRARSLVALGDLEGATQEARLLTSRVKKKRLPAGVQSFVADIRGRLEERSIQSVQSVLVQPIPELQKAVANLSGLDTSTSDLQTELPVILKRVGGNIEKFFRDFSTTAALEVIRQARLDRKGKSTSLRRAELYYVFMHRKIKGQPLLEEFRGSGDGNAMQIGGLEDGFMVTSGFASSLIVFHPVYQPGLDFRYLGRQNFAGRTVHVVGFAQRPEDSQPVGVFRATNRRGSAQIFIQGVAWISADDFQVLRLRTDLLHPIKEADLHRQTSEIDYRPYRFLTSSRSFCLPSRVTVSIEWGRRRLRNEHIFSRFWLFDVNVESEEPVERKAAEARRASGAQ